MEAGGPAVVHHAEERTDLSSVAYVSAASPRGGRRGFDAKPVVVFFVLAYTFSWAWVIPWTATGHTVYEGHGWPTHFPSVLGPMLAAFVVTAWTAHRRGIRALSAAMIRWRIGWRWWIAAVSPLLCLVVVLGVLKVSGARTPPLDDFARFSGVPAGLGIVGVTLVIILVDGLGEETGWRGYAQPQLQRRFGPITATLIIALLWAGWHFPLFFFLDSYKGFKAPMLPVFVLGLACGALILTWMYNHTGSILAVAVWHGLYDMTGGTKGASESSGVISAAIWTFVVIMAITLLVLEHRARRSDRPSILAAS